ncbi:MAG: hypothetical protein EBR27_09490 [Betaproteobacteria bacterium]|nr:hypothetical protein [Betaproteobacteria bacterium]NBY72372.1 hypothetical protein [Betaproteobacteria bacterium]NDD11876.1 hypothetical protein [Betaproteobacteria bacterium]
MKLQADAHTAQTITSYGPGWISVNGKLLKYNVVIDSHSTYSAWQASGFDELQPAHFSVLGDLKPELVLLGTGAKQRFPHPRLYSPLMAHGIGLETMTTAAACRTFNILSAEGRHVVVALLL